jgi:PPOX class probable F420-dependent enzyme
MIDFTTTFGKRVLKRLKTEKVIWLVTVGPDRTPQPRPVWFLWDGDTFLIYSQPEAHKIRHLERGNRVALHLNSDAEGDDVVVFTGEARVDTDAPPARDVPAYLAKYRKGIAGLDSTPEGFSRDYSVALRVTPTSLRGY